MRQYAYNGQVPESPEYPLARLFQALGNPSRLRLLQLIGHEEICVCKLVEALAQPQPKISQQLALLRRLGLVEARREGKWMYYRRIEPACPEARQALDAALGWMRRSSDFRQPDRSDCAPCPPNPPARSARP